MRTLLALALALLAVAVAGSAPPSLAAQPTDAERQKETIKTIRETGSALFYWAVDAAGERTADAEADAKPAAEGPPTVRWSDCPAVAHEEVERLLVPRYLAAVPRTDAWGGPLEFCVDAKGVSAHGQRVLGVRSAGADGKFEGDVYTVGAFDPAQTDRDMVWMDGYFMTWPQRK